MFRRILKDDYLEKIFLLAVHLELSLEGDTTYDWTKDSFSSSKKTSKNIGLKIGQPRVSASIYFLLGCG